MAEPTEVEIAAFTNVKSILDWVGLAGDNGDALLRGLGCVGTDHFRPLGGMPEVDFNIVVAALTVSDGAGGFGPPSPYILASWKLVGHVARLATGATLTRAKQNAQLLQQALIQQPGQQVMPPATQQGVKVGITKLAGVIDQGLDDEIKTATDAEIGLGYQRYEARMGKPPSEEREPSIDQFTGIRHLLSLNAPPFADFSVFGPHSIRLRKRMRLGGFFLSSDGSLQKCELFGPVSYVDWAKSYRVLCTVLLMLEAVFPEELDAYEAHIHEFSTRYGERCWPTIYQADVRMRQERMQTLRRRGVSMHTADPAAAARAGFDPAVPWRFVWNEAVADAGFWLQEVQEKCLLVLTKVSSPESQLDGDVRIAAGSTSLPAMLAGGGTASRDRSPRRPAAQSGKGRDVRRREVRVHNIGDDGFMKTNRAGKEICSRFQNGECDKTPGNSIVCPRDRSRVHQCSRCLSQDHGAHSPQECKASSRSEPSVRKGQKGKGRGSKY